MNERYQILDKIADGGMGAVYRGWDGNLGREVAIKRLRHAESGGVEQLVREARTLSALQHPNITTVYDVGVDAEGAFIVMELIKGETLDDIIARGALTLPDFESLVAQTLEGMIAAHAAGLIHLDMKPGNLMITWHASGRFQVKILDFGLAQANQPAGQETEDQEGVLGSVYFMAPEQFERGLVDARTDIYALGAIFYYALTQQYPFQGETSPQVMVSHLYHRFIPLARVRPDLPQQLTQWVEWLMNRLPAERPESVRQALDSFKAMRQAEAAPIAAVAVEDSGTIKKKLLPAGQIGQQPKPHAAATVKTPGRVTGPLGHALPVRPLPPPKKAGIPKWTYVTIPFLVILIGGFAVMRFLERSRAAERDQRYADLVTADHPQGSDLDVRLLLEYLDDPKTSAGAAEALRKLEGGDYIDAMLMARLDDLKTTIPRANLTKVLGLRGVKTALERILPLTADKETEVRKSAWTALGMITGDDDLDKLIGVLSNASAKERDFAEQALVSAVEAAADTAAAAKTLANAYDKLGTDNERAILLQALGRVGGEPSLAVLTKAIADDAVEVRRAAASAIAQWPTHEPLTTLTARLPQETDPANRLLLLVAATQLLSQTGPSPQGELLHQAQRLHEAARDSREKDQALAAISRIIDPATVSFFAALAISEPQKKREAEAISKAIQAQLDKAVKVTNASTKLTAAQADYQRATGMTVMADTLVNWLNEADWAGWLLHVETAGDYEIIVTQASTAEHKGSYEVIVAGKRFISSVMKTSGSTDFKSFAVGKATFAAPGIYRIRISAKSIPEKEALFRLKGLELRKA